MKKLSNLKLNVLNGQALNEKEMGQLSGGCFFFKPHCRPKPKPQPSTCDSGYGPDNSADNPGGSGEGSKPKCPLLSFLKSILCR